MIHFFLPRRRVFIAYRRKDTAGYAGRLHEALQRKLGRKNVWMDIHGTPSGTDYFKQASRKVENSDVLVVLIGDRWNEPANRTRLGEAEDLLRVEIETGLKCGLTILPILVDDARMPTGRELPAGLAKFARIQARKISNVGWSQDIRKVVKEARKSTRRRTGQQGVQSARGVLHVRMRTIAALALVLNGGIAVGTLYRENYMMTRSIIAPAQATVPVTRIDHPTFFRLYESRIDNLSPRQRQGLETVLSLMHSDSTMNDLRKAAYVLATIKYETAARFVPMEEDGRGAGKPYGTRYYGGRGYVQLTGEQNYRKMTRELDLSGTDDLVEHPERALEPEIAYRITSHGMQTGFFAPGRALADYIRGETADYVNARRTVNGQDHARSIARDARDFELILDGSVVRAPSR